MISFLIYRVIKTFWDKVDAEIFDDSLEWVIAVTHEDVSMVFSLNVTIDEYDYQKDMMQ